MKNKTCKFFTLLLLALIIFFFAGCAPVINPEGGVNEFITGTITDSDDGTPISNIKITSNYGSTVTDENGYFEIVSYYLVDATDSTTISNSKMNAYHELLLEDIDESRTPAYKTTKKSPKAGISKPVIFQMEKDL